MHISLQARSIFFWKMLFPWTRLRRVCVKRSAWRKMITLLVITYIVMMMGFVFRADVRKPQVAPALPRHLVFPHSSVYSWNTDGSGNANENIKNNNDNINNNRSNNQNPVNKENRNINKSKSRDNSSYFPGRGKRNNANKSPEEEDVGVNLQRRNDIIKIRREVAGIRNEIDEMKSAFLLSNRPVANNDKDIPDPDPLPQPFIDVNVTHVDAGDFLALGKETFVYSIYIDDRKEETYYRILTLASKTASRLFIYCHFGDPIYKAPRKSDFYELCENHNKRFGGYIYSCRVPSFLDTTSRTHIEISLTRHGPKIEVPLLKTRPPEYKVKLLDSVVSSKQKEETVTLIPPEVSSVTHALSFAICVPPLFGDISEYRLVEFLELSRLIGADHVFFYNYQIPANASRVLAHYASKNFVTKLPWKLPADMAPSSLWYHGQLLAHNDCLYRAMPNFDLVAFNDLDEFIVPHGNKSGKMWKEAFSELWGPERCGFSFRSAFYDPGVALIPDTSLKTPSLTARTENFSKVRSKVMLSPWRVFEVGIHHISKQNKEEWSAMDVDPSKAYVHHYRRCVGNYGMRCDVLVWDNTITARYLHKLSPAYRRALEDIFGTDLELHVGFQHRGDVIKMHQK